MSNLNWEGLSEDLVEILGKDKSLNIKYSIEELTWATGDSRIKVFYEVLTKDSSWMFSEDYSLDKNDEDDGDSIAESNLYFLKNKMEKKGYKTKLEDSILNVYCNSV